MEVVRKNIAIVNVATKTNWYQQGQKRLHEKILEQKFCHSVHTLISEDSVGCLPHEQDPYGFKVNAINKLSYDDFHVICWMDASVFPVRNMDRMLEHIEAKGYLFETLPNKMCGDWTNERTLKYFGLTREMASKMPMFNTSIICLDLTNPIAVDFLIRLSECKEEGLFKQDAEDTHPHLNDTSCASIIANYLKMEFTKPGDFINYDNSTKDYIFEISKVPPFV